MPFEDLENKPSSVLHPMHDNPVVWNALGFAFIIGAILLYIYQLGKVTSLFLKDLGAFPALVVLHESNLIIFSLAYLGIMVAPTFAIFIGIGFFRRKSWVPLLLEIGFIAGALFELNNFVLSYKFNISFAQRTEVFVLFAVALVVLYVLRERSAFDR